MNCWVYCFANCWCSCLLSCRVYFPLNFETSFFGNFIIEKPRHWVERENWFSTVNWLNYLVRQFQEWSVRVQRNCLMMLGSTVILDSVVSITCVLFKILMFKYFPVVFVFKLKNAEFHFHVIWQNRMGVGRLHLVTINLSPSNLVWFLWNNFFMHSLSLLPFTLLCMFDGCLLILFCLNSSLIGVLNCSWASRLTLAWYFDWIKFLG